MKYILFSCSDDTLPTVRIFDDTTGHSEVRAEVQSGKPGLEVVSAGQIWINGKSVSCVHKSFSLGLPHSNILSEQAAETIKRLLMLG